MSRLIDADKLVKAVEDLPNCYNGFSDTYDKACIIGVIDKQPTISPKRGKWIKLYAGNYKCSVCGDWWGNDDNEMAEDFNYCPNCGARMREDGGEENQDGFQKTL